MGLAKLGELLRARGDKAKDFAVRKLSQHSKRGMRKVFGQSRNLRKFSMGGAFVGMGVVLLVVFVYDKLKARAQRHYRFVDRHFDTAARSWKRDPATEDRVLREHFWPVYRLALAARDTAPPFADEESFVRLARRAIDADLPLLEGENEAGEPSRIPFGQAQKLFAAPPFCAAKNSVNDLRFSWYREIRDRHLGAKRYLLDAIQSSPFENFLLLGFRRDLCTMISRALRATEEPVRLEDILGTADPRWAPAAVGPARDRIRAYVARKLLPGDEDLRKRVWLVLEAGLVNAVRELVLSDPVLLGGQAFRQAPDGSFRLEPIDYDLVRELGALAETFGRGEDSTGWDPGKLASLRTEAREWNRKLLAFLDRHDPEHRHARDAGDVRAARMALQIDRKLRKRLAREDDVPGLLASFDELRERQTDYDRALIELRSAYAACLADFGFYRRFLAENFAAYRDHHPGADYDPPWAKIFPALVRWLRDAWRRVRQLLQIG
jgi:hypothetical protein